MLNVDLGEGEAPETSIDFIRYVDAANIACGGHAGSNASIRHCLQACLEQQTLAGAHPGLTTAFGRGSQVPTHSEFTELLETQWNRIECIAQSVGISLHHIKLHGSLYMAVERSEELANTYLNFLSDLNPTPIVFSLADGTFIKRARAQNLPVWGELFGDRQYEPDGTIRSRDATGALIEDPHEITQRLQNWLKNGTLRAVDSSWISLSAHTICLHSDTANALTTARQVQRLLSGMREQQI